jgi:hypothetical protein
MVKGFLFANHANPQPNNNNNSHHPNQHKGNDNFKGGIYHRFCGIWIQFGEMDKAKKL